jgi:hypothetical protein
MFPYLEFIYSNQRWTVHVAQMGEKRDMYRVLVGKLEGKRPLGRLQA